MGYNLEEAIMESIWTFAVWYSVMNVETHLGADET